MKLAKNISFFTFFNLVNAGIPFLLLPVLTTYLSPEDYGIIDIFNSLTMLFTPIVGLSAVGSINRYYFEKEEVDIKVFVNTILRLIFKYGVVFILICTVIGFLFKEYLNKSFGLPIEVLILASLYVFFSQISEILLTLWRISYNTVKYGVFRILKTFFDVGLSLFLIVKLNFKWEGRIAPQLIMALVFGLIAVYILSKSGFIKKEIKTNKGYKSKILSYSIPLIFHSLSGYIIGISDRFFILFMEGVEYVGVYGVAYQIGMVIGLFQNSFNQAWLPFFFSSLKEESKSLNLKIVKITYLYFILMILLVVFFYFMTPLIYNWFIGDNFSEGMNVVIWVLLGYGFNGMYKMAVNYLFYLKKTKIIAFSTIIVGCINLVLNYFLIKRNGINGAAQATAISFFIHFLIVQFLGVKYYKMPWRLNR